MSSPSPSSLAPPILHGSCHCLALTWTSTALPSHLTNCHCRTCRRLAGAPFLTWGDVPTDALTVTTCLSSSSLPSPPSHSPLTTSPSPLAERTHCARCGSQITMRYHCQRDIVSVAAGTMDDGDLVGTGIRVTQEIFLAEKAGWWDLRDGNGDGDGVRRWEGFEEGFERVLEAWKEGGGKGKEKGVR